MKKNWKDIEWIFKADGALRAIYILNSSISDWKKVIAIINQKYHVNFRNSDEGNFTKKIDDRLIIDYLTNRKKTDETKLASILIGEIRLNCHFFQDDEIEFDINPKEINSIKDFELIESFMYDISETLGKEVILKYDDLDAEIPLIKIHVNKGIDEVLSKHEIEEYWKNKD
ncbi:MULTISPECIES: hypothetical protein [Cellulophaga]|uniref:Uncharacterized protein n=1 Tax=Cellulophaga baltica TaxID=76594 RepID=A0A1G7LM48_9FLAO|nr:MULTISPECIES: hypothetical protein [Cellulophaga]AIY14005.1 hypothetical protein M667_12750 [Cellulophaga baltica NN016038]MBA6316229.1 hypothetical protein [Cellulophaga baltica]QXP52523.1 hypothetical protein H0I24_00945 [Cellulophaga sp. HaHa_2_1]SDF50019.1 hypothetical protein SAMN04487992_1194 [Cellulophaga baltica]